MRILIAVDGSQPAERAVDLVATVPWRSGCRIRLVSAAPTRSEILGLSWGMAIPPDAAALEASVVNVHREALARAEREIRCAQAGLDVEPVLVRGRAASAIVDQARDMGADLVVVGHRGVGPWESLLLGSVSAEVVDHAPCPVLVVRDDELGPVVLADDGSSHARAAEALVAAWPLFDGLPVTVVNVVEDGFMSTGAVAPALYADSIMGYTDAIETERRARASDCERVVARLGEHGRAASVAVRTGDPAHEIVACARQRGAGVIVIGSRGQTGLRRLVLGSVARNILFHAPCSVLVVREGASVDGARLPVRQEREVVGAFG